MNTADAETQCALSVVVAAWSGEVALKRCLESLMPQAQDVEVIVAFRGTLDPATLMEDRYPNVRFMSAPPDATVFRLRSLGLHETRGASIAMLEDHSVVCLDWVKALVSAQAAGLMICGGPIDNDSESSAYDWALYFAEYGSYMLPRRSGEVALLSGANIYYDRAILWSCSSIWESHFYETDVNAALVNAGHKLHMLPNALVTSRLRIGLAEAMEHLFSGGLHFGNFRKSRAPRLAQWFWVIASPAIPVVMLLRIFRVTATRRPVRLLQLIRSLPYLLLLLCAWSLGEAAGYLRNAPTEVSKA